MKHEHEFVDEVCACGVVACSECGEKGARWGTLCRPCHRNAHCLRCLAEPKGIRGLCGDCYDEWAHLEAATWKTFVESPCLPRLCAACGDVDCGLVLEDGRARCGNGEGYLVLKSGWIWEVEVSK